MVLVIERHRLSGPTKIMISCVTFTAWNIRTRLTKIIKADFQNNLSYGNFNEAFSKIATVTKNSSVRNIILRALF